LNARSHRFAAVTEGAASSAAAVARVIPQIQQKANTRSLSESDAFSSPGSDLWQKFTLSLGLHQFLCISLALLIRDFGSNHQRLLSLLNLKVKALSSNNLAVPQNSVATTRKQIKIYMPLVPWDCN
jgi:hypothetical protein